MIMTPFENEMMLMMMNIEWHITMLHSKWLHSIFHNNRWERNKPPLIPLILCACTARCTAHWAHEWLNRSEIHASLNRMRISHCIEAKSTNHITLTTAKCRNGFIFFSLRRNVFSGSDFSIHQVRESIEVALTPNRLINVVFHWELWVRSQLQQQIHSSCICCLLKIKLEFNSNSNCLSPLITIR